MQEGERRSPPRPDRTDEGTDAPPARGGAVAIIPGRVPREIAPALVDRRKAPGVRLRQEDVEIDDAEVRHKRARLRRARPPPAERARAETGQRLEDAHPV